MGPTTDVQTEREYFYDRLLQVYKDDALHRSATLDESYYHFGSDKASREDRDYRNSSQVVTEYLEGEKREPGKKREPGEAFTLIRVKQLWVWTIMDGKCTLLSPITFLGLDA